MTTSSPHPTLPADGLFSAVRLSGTWPRIVGALALAAALMSRALVPALPGSRTGIGVWITRTEFGASLLSQLYAFTACLVGLWLLLATLRDRRLSIAYRMAAAPLAAAVLTMVLAAARGPIDAQWTLGLGLLAAVLAAMAVPRALSSATTRALGLILAATAIAALLQVVARVLALTASSQAQPTLFSSAQGLATGAWMLDLAALATAAVWLGARRWRWVGPTLALLLLVAGILTWSSSMGAAYDARFFEVLTTRMLGALGRHPAPLIDPWWRNLLEVAAAGLTVLVLCTSHRGAAVHGATALVLVARSATDIPGLALALALAALITPLAAVTRDRTWVVSSDPEPPEASVPAPTELPSAEDEGTPA